MIKSVARALIPVAGLGTRLLSATKEQPKEMLPILVSSENGTLCLKPMVQQIFEQLFDFGIREFYFIVGKTKRAIEDHFTPDWTYVEHLIQKHNGRAVDLRKFYERVESSTIVWLNQPYPKGFGDAVAMASHLFPNEPFLVHAGDTVIIPENESVIERMVQAHIKTGPEAILVLKEIEDPRSHGVANVKKTSDGMIEVEKVVEKPSNPTSKLAIMPLYLFTHTIFDALKTTEADKDGEVQLTDAIQKLVDDGHKVQAIKLAPNDVRLDIGTPETYWETINLSYHYASKSLRKTPMQHLTQQAND